MGGVVWWRRRAGVVHTHTNTEREREREREIMQVSDIDLLLYET